MTTPLQIELALPAYAGLTDDQAAAALNAPISGTQAVPLGPLKLLLYQDATPCAMLRIAAAAETPDTTVSGAQAAARQANAYLNDPHIQTIDFTNPIVSAGLALLVQSGVVSQALLNRAKAMGQTVTTRGRQLRYAMPITAAMVNTARGGT
jgi:hypothetical protein